VSVWVYAYIQDCAEYETALSTECQSKIDFFLRKKATRLSLYRVSMSQRTSYEDTSRHPGCPCPHSRVPALLTCACNMMPAHAMGHVHVTARGVQSDPTVVLIILVPCHEPLTKCSNIRGRNGCEMEVISYTYIPLVSYTNPWYRYTYHTQICTSTGTRAVYYIPVYACTS
jgi:hypothetical protein